jgi:hypothetical protein
VGASPPYSVGLQGTIHPPEYSPEYKKRFFTICRRERLNDGLVGVFIKTPPPGENSLLVITRLSGSVYRGFTHNMKSHFDQVVDLGEHDNSKIKRAVLPHTELKYERALRIYDQLVPICVNSTLIMIDT